MGFSKKQDCGKWAVFAVVMLITFIPGAFIDWVGIIFVLIPILAPIIPKLGFNPLWFAMMVIVNLQMSFMTPPFAYAMPFVGIIAIGLVLLIIFPEIVLRFFDGAHPSNHRILDRQGKIWRDE